MSIDMNNLPLVADFKFDSDINDSLGNFEFTNMGAYIQNYAPKDNYQLIERDGYNGIQLTKGTASRIWYNTIVFKSNIKPLDVFKIEFDFYSESGTEYLFNVLMRDNSTYSAYSMRNGGIYIKNDTSVRCSSLSGYTNEYYTLSESIRNKWNTCRIEFNIEQMLIYVNDELACKCYDNSNTTSVVLRLENFTLCGQYDAEHDATIKNLKIYGDRVFLGFEKEFNGDKFSIKTLLNDKFDTSEFTYIWYSDGAQGYNISSNKDLLNVSRPLASDMSYGVKITTQYHKQYIFDCIVIPRENETKVMSIMDLSNNNLTIKSNGNDYIIDESSDHIVEIDDITCYCVDNGRVVKLNSYNNSTMITNFVSFEFSIKHDINNYNDVLYNRNVSSYEKSITIFSTESGDALYYRYDMDSQKWYVSYGTTQYYFMRVCEGINPFEWHHFYVEIASGSWNSDYTYYVNVYIDGKIYGCEIRNNIGKKIQFYSYSQYATASNGLYSKFYIKDFKTYNNYVYRSKAFDPPSYIPIPTPKAIITCNKSIIQENDNIILSALNSYISDGSQLTYLWSNGLTTSTIDYVATEKKIISLTVTSGNGYTDTTNFLIDPQVAPPTPQYDPVAVITTDKKTCLIGETITLSGVNSYCQGSSIVSYLWNNGETTDTIEITPQETSVYTLTVTALNGLSNTARITINVETGEIELMKYLPLYWHENLEMKQIQKNSLNYLLYDLNTSGKIINDESFISSMSESRLKEWELSLGVASVGTIAERKAVILSFFNSKGKLNETIIKNIVKMYGNDADCMIYLAGGNINIIVYPKNENDVNFTSIKSILEVKKPAHLGIFIDRYWAKWQDIKNDFETWQDVKDKGTWYNISLYLPQI